MVVITSPDLALVQRYAGKFPGAAIPVAALSTSQLKLLRPKQRVKQIAHDEKGHDQSDDKFQCHIELLQTIAGAGVEPGESEKADRDADKNDVRHLPLLRTDQPSVAQAKCQRVFGFDEFFGTQRKAGICKKPNKDADIQPTFLSFAGIENARRKQGLLHIAIAGQSLGGKMQ